MHILMVTVSFPSPEYPYRGTFIGEQVKRLLDHVDRITVLCPTSYVPRFARFSRVAAQASLPARYELVKDRCEVLFPRYLKAPGNMCVWWTAAQWRRLVSNTVREFIDTRPCSLIHANKGGVSSWSAIQAARQYGIPCVVTYQGTEVHTDLVNQQNEWRLSRDSFRFADLNVLVSRSLERILKTYVQPQGRCEVMLRGVDLKMFFPPQGGNARRPMILFVGRVTEAKGIFDLLEAWREVTARCEGVELWIVGPNHTDARVLRAIESHGLTQQIRILGPLPLREVADLMRQAQVLCLPSHGEGTPNCVMEAMACGLPVVATEVGGIPDIIESYRTGILVRKGNTQELSEALVSLLQDTVQRERMGDAAYEFARKYFDARKTAERLAGLYDELVTTSCETANPRVG